ncbi:hypothetical protein [Falsirhodobacter halotolerans]|uniref:hypothetical protein n=1 Tax=Falsirhodobacter halotolerans TaxID=1146892 RepID=UPI001FD07B42|nr:hypothetical protein [Falsirhodobacter halotolerans]MCJ8140229.1 hypothetical protein [Falsirhodobacter halotolerans]
MRAWLILALLAFGLACGGHGWRMGHRAADTAAALRLAEAQTRAEAAAAAARRAEAARLRAVAERDRLFRTLEDAAHADPDASALSLRADSVRRLNQR